MCLYKRVSDQDSILMVYKNFFFGKEYSTNTVSCNRNFLTIKFTDVFMSFRAKIISLILM